MPDSPRNKSRKVLSGDDFAIWQKSRGLSYAEIGRYLDMTYQAVQRLRQDGLSRVQALALSAIDRGLKPWQPTDEDRAAADQAGTEPDSEATSLRSRRSRSS